MMADFLKIILFFQVALMPFQSQCEEIRASDVTSVSDDLDSTEDHTDSSGLDSTPRNVKLVPAAHPDGQNSKDDTADSIGLNYVPMNVKLIPSTPDDGKNSNDGGSTHKEETLNKKPANFNQDMPLQIVKPDLNHNNLVLIPENLEVLKNISGPVAVISVVGKYHSGKSFLLNQIMNKSSGFGVGSTVQPQTMGMWIWGKPLSMALPSGHNVNVILLDTEGFAARNVSEMYDAKIFTIATLLSSFLIHNSVKIIDQTDIDYLELLARRAQIFSLKSQMAKNMWIKEFNDDLLTFPPLLWVVQDFAQDTEGRSAQDWIFELMATHTRENDNYQISLLDLFSDVDCVTMFYPVHYLELLEDLSKASEGDLTRRYKNDRAELLNKLQKKLKPKEKNGRPITSHELVNLLKMLVDAANEGTLTEVPSRWKIFIENLRLTAVQDCLKFYSGEISALMENEADDPINENILKLKHQHFSDKSLVLLSQLLVGLDEDKETAEKSLLTSIKEKFERFYDLNDKKLKLKCSTVIRKLELRAEDELKSLALPMSTSQFNEEIQSLVAKYRAMFKTELKDLISLEMEQNQSKLLVSFLLSIGNSFLLENRKLLESLLDSEINQVVVNFRETMKAQDKVPRTTDQFNKVISKWNEAATQLFERNTEMTKNESFYQPYRSMLQVKLQELTVEANQMNQEFISQSADDLIKTLLNYLEENTKESKIVLPLTEADLDDRFRVFERYVLRTYKDKMQEFADCPVYQEQSDKLEKLIKKRKDELKQANMNAFVKEVETPMKTARDIVIMSGHNYNTVFGFKEFIREVCLINLNHGKAKDWSNSLKYSIIDHFINNDKDLQRLIKSKEGFWSSFIGLFQWLFSFFSSFTSIFS